MASSPLSKTTGVTSVIAVFFSREVFRHLLPPLSKFDNAEYLKTDELRKSSYCIVQYYIIYVYEKVYRSLLYQGPSFGGKIMIGGASCVS